MFVRLWIVSVAILVAGCAGPSIATNDRGTDAGTIVVGLGAADDTFQNHWIYFCRKTDALDPAKPHGSFADQVRSLFGGQPPDDETDDDKGVVITAMLPEGDYEAYGFSQFFNGGMVQGSFGTKQPFSIPFTIRRGAVGHLSNDQATSFKGRNLLGIPVLAGAFYAVEDRRDADVAIAVRKGLLLPSSGVDDYTPDPAVLADPLIVSPAERDRRKSE